MTTTLKYTSPSVEEWLPKIRKYLKTQRAYVKSKNGYRDFIEIYPGYSEYRANMFSKMVGLDCPVWAKGSVGGKTFMNIWSGDAAEVFGANEVAEWRSRVTTYKVELGKRS